ncbi:MAG: tRNA epoxyqueuosine(34) reductase QueG [Geminicoccaceae bacterium]|nr:tRNA epoxyqueuosine(34) reductase QueG [Geminicoccaceae bacterium]
MATPSLREELRARALRLGFADLRIAPAEIAPARSLAYRRFVDEGRAGTMDWLARAPERRASPRGMWPEARTALVLGMNYGPKADPLPGLARRTAGYVSVYARGRDYHEVMKGRLKEVAGLLHRRTGAEVKVFVDTAPLLEKPLAQRAGLGWQGKHTNLVSRRHGSWLFLGTILTTAEIEADPAEGDHCGGCRRCVAACPTGAITRPYALDPRRCIAYLTIEHEGAIPEEFREAIGNRVYGCDDCLAVCPWNKFAHAATEVRLQAREEAEAPPLAELAALDEAGFAARFRGTPVRRIGLKRLRRNVLIAIGNSGERALAGAARAHLGDPDPVVAEAAGWAVGRLPGDGG